MNRVEKRKQEKLARKEKTATAVTVISAVTALLNFIKALLG